jgi:hypothetical protein
MSEPSNHVSRESDLLMRTGVTATCADCGDQRIFVPVEEGSTPGEFCCTGCDAAVFLMSVLEPAGQGRPRRVA